MGSKLTFHYRSFVFVILFAVSLAIYTDFIAYSKLGYLLCFVLSTFVIFYSIFDPVRTLILGLGILFLFPVYPRDILTIYYDLQVNHNIQFYSILYSRFVGFSFAQWIFLGFGISSIMQFLRVGKVFFDRRIMYLIILALILWMLLYISTFWDLLRGRDFFLLKEFISDQRYFVIFLFGLFITYRAVLKDNRFYEKFVGLLIFISLIVGLRVIVFLLFDFVDYELKYYYATLPYLLFPVLLGMIFAFPHVRKIPIYFLVLLGSFNISRGDITFMLLDVILMAALIFLLKTNFFVRISRLLIVTLILFLFVVAIPAILYLVNKNVFEFLLLKLQFFTEGLGKGEFSKSTLVRIYEFKNIFSEVSGNVVSLLLGRGFGGYFTFKAFPFPRNLDISDYTLFELTKNIYFHPHTFINYTLLKGGLLFFLFHILVSIFIFINGFYLIKTSDRFLKFLGAFSLFYAIFSLNSYWLPQYLFFNSVLIVVLTSCRRRIKFEKESCFRKNYLCY